MTFNVRRDVAADGDNAWAHRREMVAETIRFHRPALVGLQEPLEHQFSFIRNHLADWEWQGVGRRDGESEGEHVPIGFDPAVVDLEEWGTFWLSETPAEPSRGWDASHPRIATWARFDPSGGDQPFLFCTTHFDHEGERARRRSAHLLSERVAALADGDPVIVIGDLNATATDEPHAILTGGSAPGLRDAGTVATHGHHGPTTTRTDFESLVPDRKIDHVLVSPDVGVHQQGVCLDAEGSYPSDHLPLVADVTIGEDA